MGHVDDPRISAAQVLEVAGESPFVDMSKPAQPIDRINRPTVIRLTHSSKIERLISLERKAASCTDCGELSNPPLANGV